MVVLVAKAGGVFRERDKTSLPDFVETPTRGGANVAVVTFENYWQETDNSLTRCLPWPRTTWIFKRGGLFSYLLRNSAADKSTVALVPSLRVDWRKMSEAVRTALKLGFVRWIHVCGNLTLSQSGEPVSVLSSCLAGTSPKKQVSRGVPHSATDETSLLYDRRSQEEIKVFKRSTKKTSLSGQVIRVACLRSNKFPDHNICLVYSELFGFLEAKNVSLEYRFHSHWSTMLIDLYCENTDMVVLIQPTNTHMLAASTYSDIMSMPETFYAPENMMQAPSLYDTTIRSILIVAVTAASLAICVGLLLLIGAPPAHQRARTESLFVLAFFRSRSTPFASATTWPRIEKLVFLFWALVMLPLSLYFLGELTSLVTGGRPAKSLYTLEDLESAIDAGATAPCVPKESASWDGIVNMDHPTTLGKKLRASLLKHRHQLVTADVRSCFECAKRIGSVCYAHRMPSSSLKRFSDPVIAFKDNFMIRPVSMPLRKSFPLRDAYRAFLQRVREGGLLSSPYCKNDMACTRYTLRERAPLKEKPLFELHGFFMFYVMLLAGTVGVFVAELLLARFSESAFGPHFLRGRWRQR
ncbi:hypothetical protein MTO96_025087 [Rhipicephalus appendiculatus]